MVYRFVKWIFLDCKSKSQLILTPSKTEYKKPVFIDHVRISEHSQVAFTYNSGGYSVSPLTPEVLYKAVEKKDKLVEAYKSNSNLMSQWLLIVIGNISPTAFEYSINQFEVSIASKFDRIYLMDN
jgi:hypothetical protein